MQDDAEGIYEIQPRKTLRDRSYGPQPLLIKPDYNGDFLKKLKEPFEGKDLNFAADSENLKDFSTPEEWLKHQEQPYPRVTLDDYYEVAKPGEDAGGEDLREWWDRSWDENDSPEISEDKWLRMWTKPSGTPGDTKMASSIISSYMNNILRQESIPCSSTVVATYLMNRFPMEAILNFENIKVAKLLTDFQKSLIHGKKPLDHSGVTVRLKRADPSVGRWTFGTSSAGGKEEHTTVFQFIPSGVIRDPNKLHVRVSCSCPSWLFWGAQYHAVLEDYLYGKIRPVFAPPRKRDVEGTFIVCKHVLACIPVVSRYSLGKMPGELKKRIQQAPKYQVQKTEEKVRIPKDLIEIGKKPEMKKIMEQWEEKPRARKGLMQKLKSPEEVAFLAHRFPSTATALAAEKLKELAKKPSLEKKALKLLDGLEEVSGKEPIKETAIPSELKKLDSNPEIQAQFKDFEGKSLGVRRKMIMSQKDPDMLAYVAHKFNHNHEILSWTIEKLHDLSLRSKNPKDRQKAKSWLKIIL